MLPARLPVVRAAIPLAVALSIASSAALSQQGPGQFEIDEEAAERALERALVQTGSVLLPSGSFEIVPFLSFSRNEQTFPGGPVLVGGSLSGSAIETEEDEFRTGVVLRAGLPWAAQVDVTLPFASSEQTVQQSVTGSTFSSTTTDLSGLGDVRVAYTQSLRGNDTASPSLLATVAWDTDTGKEDGSLFLGTGFDEVEVSLATTMRQDPLVFTGRVGYQRAFESSGIRPGEQFSLSGSTFLAVNPETSLKIGLSLTHSDETEVNGNSVAGTDQFAASLDLGLATILGRNTLLDTTFSIGLTDDTPELGIRVNLPLRLQF